MNTLQTFGVIKAQVNQLQDRHMNTDVNFVKLLGQQRSKPVRLINHGHAATTIATNLPYNNY